MKAFLAIAVIVGIVLFINSDKTKYSDVWWDGTEVQTICRLPYYNLNECYTLNVSASKEINEVLSVSFRNGGYINFGETWCEKPADGQGIDRMCTMSEADTGAEWQVVRLK